MRQIFIAIVALGWVCCLNQTAAAQSLDQRIEYVRQKQARQEQAAARQVAFNLAPRTSSQALASVIDTIELNDIPAQQALQWAANVAGFNLVLSTTALENAGVDLDRPVTIRLRRVSAGRLVQMILTEMSPLEPLVLEVNNEYVRVMTKAQADLKPIVRIYSIADLLMEIPDFDGAPKFDLNSIASDSESGGDSIFEDDDTETVVNLTREERAERIADVIRQSIEPNIWQANGGLAGSIRYLQGNLIIRAPAYVHGRIQLPRVASPQAAAPRAYGVGSGYPIGYRPQIGVVNSGAQIDATGTVSRDLRYVTFSGSVTNAELESIRTFPIAPVPQTRRINVSRPGDPGSGVSGIDYSQAGR